MGLISQSELERIIRETDNIDAAKLLVEKANVAGRQLKDQNLTTSQIRALFGEVRQIESQMSGAKTGSDGDGRFKKALNRLILLKPKMAYRSAKESGKGVGDLVGILDPAVDLVVQGADEAEQAARFARFVELFEAILAYHRFHGGR